MPSPSDLLDRLPALRAALGAAGTVLALLAPDAASAAEDEAPAIQETLDVHYGDARRQTLDVFSPKDERDCPVVLFVHGGAWTLGDKDLFGLYRGVGRFLARHGVTAVCINYRLSPLVKHPEHVKDVARAFAWVRAHAADYGGDPDRILLCGHSAGGHLVSLLASDESYLKDGELKLTDADRAAIRGVLSVSGVYRVPTQEEFASMVGDMLAGLGQMTGAEGLAASPLGTFLMRNNRELNPFRMVFGDDAAGRAASPLTHVYKGMPPFLVLYAEHELPKLDAMAQEFVKAMQDAGAPVECKRIDGCNHNNIVFRLHNADDPTAAALLPFIAKYGGKPKP
jgi:acetyl esterase/lipase